MDWLKKHADTAVVLSTILGSVVWMNAQFNRIEKDILIIKTVLIMKDVMPKELANIKYEKKTTMDN